MTTKLKENNVNQGGCSPRVSHCRDRAIDAAKGCGILLVIFGHVCHLHPYWSIIYSFHMPLFFFIAGMNFYPEKYPDAASLLQKKLRAMIIPYLFFCFLGVAYSLFWRLFSGVSGREIADYLLQLPYAIVWMPYSHYSQLFNTPLWFVPCLVLLEVMFYFLNRIRKEPVFWIAVCCITVLGWLMERPESPVDFTFLPWNFSTACFALFIFAVGNRVRGIVKKRILEPEMTWKQVLLLAAVFIPAFLITGYVGAHNSGSFGSRELNNGFLFILTGLTGTLCVLIGARFLKNSRILKYYGRNSFTVMGCQIPIFWAVVSLLKNMNAHVSQMIPIYTESSILQCIAMFMTVALLCALFTAIYNKCRTFHAVRNVRGAA